MHVDFGKRVLLSIAKPDTGRLWVYDTAGRGLAMMITATGARSLYVYRRVNGKPQRIRLGAFPDISVDVARKLAEKYAVDIANGRNPIAERRAIRSETTLGEVWTRYEAERLNRKRSANTDRSRWEHHLSKLEARPLSQITTADVATWHNRIGRTQPSTANRALALLSGLFKFARQMNFAGANPCHGVARFGEEPRDRFLNADELARLATALKAEPQLYADLFNLCIWTGQRQGNVRSMAWQEIDLKAARWTIPASKFKTGKAQTVPLLPPAVEILGRRRKAVDSPWVFPQDGNPKAYVTNPTKSWRRICKAAKLPGVRIHDLRRTAGSWLAASGANLSVIGKALGHRTMQTTAGYARLNLDPVREAMAISTAAMQAAMGGESPDNPK